MNKHIHIFKLFFIKYPFLFWFGVIAPSGEVPFPNLCSSLRVIGLSEIGLDFCGAGNGVTEGFERGSPWSLPPHVHTCLLGIPLHFQALLCLWPWSLESRRKCIPVPALNDHITLNPPGSMIPLQSWKSILLLLEKNRDQFNLSECRGSVLSFFSSVNQWRLISAAV